VDFYQMCFDAFAQTEWQVVLSFGTRIDPAALKEPPANFLIAPHVPQLEVLSRADLFISHGGMNSTMESL
jgi:UDP:flavonoid glycosyltransferase YjiC (YdhE family)